MERVFHDTDLFGTDLIEKKVRHPKQEQDHDDNQGQVEGPGEDKVDDFIEPFDGEKVVEEPSEQVGEQEKDRQNNGNNDKTKNSIEDVPPAGPGRS